MSYNVYYNGEHIASFESRDAARVYAQGFTPLPFYLVGCDGMAAFEDISKAPIVEVHKD